MVMGRTGVSGVTMCKQASSQDCCSGTQSIVSVCLRASMSSRLVVDFASGWHE